MLAEGKDVHREVKSEGSRMQNAGLTNRKRLRRHKSPKPNTHTERGDVQPTGISRKVARITPGYLPLCQCATGVVRRRHGATEVSRRRSSAAKPAARRAEHD